MRTLEERIQELEDIEAIRRLKIRYAQLCDANYQADKIAELFTEDGVLDMGHLGVVRGRDAIRKQFLGVAEHWTFAIHYLLGDAIDRAPSGEDATGAWYLWGAATVDGRPILVALTYDDSYRRVNGQWLFSRQKLNAHFRTPYELGWAKERSVV